MFLWNGDGMRPFACDGVLIEHGKILLIKRGKRPELGKWAIPGGLIKEDETAEECLRREMLEETGLSVEPIRFFGIYSNPSRDPRKTISAVYLVKRKEQSTEPKPGSDAIALEWFDLEKLPELAFDHEEIIHDIRITLSRSLQGPQG